MSSKRNQTIAIARFLMYKYGLNQQLDGMTDEEYLAHPIGLDVGQYVADLMKYCPEHIVDQVMEHQDALLRRLGTDYLTVIVVGIVLLLTGGANDKTSAENMGGESYAVVLDE